MPNVGATVRRFDLLAMGRVMATEQSSPSYAALTTQSAPSLHPPVNNAG